LNDEFIEPFISTNKTQTCGVFATYHVGWHCPIQLTIYEHLGVGVGTRKSNKLLCTYLTKVN